MNKILTPTLFALLCAVIAWDVARCEDAPKPEITLDEQIEWSNLQLALANAKLGVVDAEKAANEWLARKQQKCGGAVIADTHQPPRPVCAPAPPKPAEKK